MSEGKKRRVYTAEFKGKVGLEAVRGVKTVTEICAGIGGGALIVDRYGDDGETPQEKSGTGQRRAADEVEMGTA